MESEKFTQIDIDPIIYKHMQLECIGVTVDNLLERIAGPYPDDISNFLVIKHSKGYSVFIAKDLPGDIISTLRKVPAEEAFINLEILKTVLRDFYPKDGPKRFKSYIFPQNISEKSFSEAVLLDQSHQSLFEEFEFGFTLPKHPSFGIIVENKLVCVCESSKEDNNSAESWVRTLEAYRGRGYAKQVTLAWAYNLQKAGKVPFYSHKKTNIQSQAVAESLKLIQYSDEVSY